MTLGEKIKEIRLGQGMYMKDFGKQFGVSKAVVWNWENDGTIPNEEHLAQIAEVGKTTVEELLNDEDIDLVWLGEKIQGMREAFGENRETFGKRFDVDQSSISRWERGLNLPHEVYLRQMAEIRGESVEEFLGKTSKEDVKNPAIEILEAYMRLYEQLNRKEVLSILAQIKKDIEIALDNDE